MTALTLLVPAVVRAATPEDRYIAARDAAIARLKAAIDAEKRGPTDAYGDAIFAAEKTARAELEQQMRAVVGPVAIKGLEPAGVLNLDTLFEGDEAFGVLDGLIFASADKKATVIVTTDGLLRHWLAEHKTWWGKDGADIPQAPEAAVQESAFYSQAVVTDAAIIRFAALPVRKPQGASFAFAMLAARSQDAMPSKAGELFVAVAQSGKAFVGWTRRFDAVGPIASCDARRAELARKSVEAARHPSGDGMAHAEEADRLSAQSETEFLHCFAAQASRQKGYAGAARAAQQLVDAIPPR